MTLPHVAGGCELGVSYWHIGSEFDWEPATYTYLWHHRRSVCYNDCICVGPNNPTNITKPVNRNYLVAHLDPYARRFPSYKIHPKTKGCQMMFLATISAHQQYIKKDGLEQHIL